MALYRQGNETAAVQHLEQLLAGQPDSVLLLTTLGELYAGTGQYRAALACFEQVLERHPGEARCRLGLARCLACRPYLALRLRSRQQLTDCLACEHLEAAPLIPAAAVLLGNSPLLTDDPLLQVVLRSDILTDLTIEDELTRLRRQWCLNPPRTAPELAGALAAQCRLNEGAWAVSAEEAARLPSAPGWVRALYEPGSADPELAERAKNIPSLTPIADGTSAQVRALYEAHPYPRWFRLTRGARVTLAEHLHLLTGGTWQPPAFLQRPRLLVAGCGTGQELLTAAAAWCPASVTGIDLSRSSLAYASLMAQRAGIDVELYQADLLRLDGWEREFDAIICTGVLHHLNDPLDGWRRLLRLLRPGGVMLVGLYSATARRGITAAQAAVRDMGVPPTQDGIRAARAHLSALPREHPAFGCTALRDFYHLGGCRDMLFHVREQCFTLPRIASALDELGLSLLAFATDSEARRLYRTLCGPGDSCACWAKLEELYPGLFLGMYRFWCRKA